MFTKKKKMYNCSNNTFLATSLRSESKIEDHKAIHTEQWFSFDTRCYIVLYFRYSDTINTNKNNIFLLDFFFLVFVFSLNLYCDYK